MKESKQATELRTAAETKDKSRQMVVPKRPCSNPPAPIGCVCISRLASAHRTRVGAPNRQQDPDGEAARLWGMGGMAGLLRSLEQ